MLEADRHLYAAKHEGRDQVVHGDPVGSPGARAAD
jgi:PleD family two-component response regulator